ncbi:SDR family NAD(P)-dependent oxidoreductase [Methylobacterium sp. J-077]|uniref:SDR family NAD(P)-dependent oxidoreductase n=1 Tax=Methylobacterium sp. J-077 TaxID=2836656 RepID=UPI001FB9FB56|nr:SDR family oxidoreductase [Methylobacterium sp. J-077]MCJ2124968.1 SDR family oxidoreductase [Methylobacterium sp. J-077]
MKIDVTGKLAIVSGSSAGIGLGCAMALAKAGADVVLVARSRDALHAAEIQVRALGGSGEVRTVEADLSTEEGCGRLTNEQPRCDILVNNLGVYDPKSFLETPDQDWQRLFDINVMCGVRLSRAYLPAMMSSGWGRVIFLSSVDGVLASIDSLHYGVTKAAVLALSHGLAKFAGTSGVTVNAVLPAVTKTEWVAAMLQGMAGKAGRSVDDLTRDAIVQRYPTSIDKRIHTVGEVANLVAYLCCPLSSATTGATFRADGGVIDTIL